ncbi:MAG: hypothetical protein QXQ57_07330 [Sulfolobales archaeon]
MESIRYMEGSKEDPGSRVANAEANGYPERHRGGCWVLQRIRENRLTEMPKEQWIGKSYVFTIPLFYHALRIISKKRSMDITVEEVIREAMT